MIFHDLTLYENSCFYGMENICVQKQLHHQKNIHEISYGFCGGLNGK